MGEKTKIEETNEENENNSEEKETNPFFKRLDMEFHLDFKQDKSLSSVAVNCKNPHKALR